MAGPGARGGPQLPYQLLAGVVPCPGGWLVAGAKLQGIQLAPEEPVVRRELVDVLDERPQFAIIALAAPIGLLSAPVKGGRACDREARALLRWPRSSAIVTPPVRAALSAPTYEEAAALSGGLNAVAWRQRAKLAEVAREMAPYRQRSVFEVHPELSFFQLNEDTPLKFPKRTQLGQQERRDLLERRIPGVERLIDTHVTGVRPWQLLDGAAALWTSRRIMAKAATRLPEDPVWDDEGLRMEFMR